MKKRKVGKEKKRTRRERGAVAAARDSGIPVQLGAGFAPSRRLYLIALFSPSCFQGWRVVLRLEKASYVHMSHLIPNSVACVRAQGRGRGLRQLPGVRADMQPGSQTTRSQMGQGHPLPPRAWPAAGRGLLPPPFKGWKSKHVRILSNCFS